MTTNCPSCGQVFSVAPEHAREQLACTACGAIFAIPPQPKAIMVRPPPRPPMPRQTVNQVFLLAAFSAGVCITAIGAAFLTNKPQPPTPLTNPAVNAANVAALFAYDSGIVAEELGGKRFSIYGTVREVRNGDLIIISDLDRTGYAARCKMRPGQNLDRLELHSLVEINGICRGPHKRPGDEVDFDECELVFFGRGEQPLVSNDSELN